MQYVKIDLTNTKMTLKNWNYNWKTTYNLKAYKQIWTMLEPQSYSDDTIHSANSYGYNGILYIRIWKADSSCTMG